MIHGSSAGPVHRDMETMAPHTTGVLLWDGGYMLRPWLVTPFMHSAGDAQSHFNGAHCSTRSTIERCNAAEEEVALLACGATVNNLLDVTKKKCCSLKSLYA